MPQDNNDACPACRSDGLTVSKVNGITQIEVPQDYAFARHGGIGPQIQRALTYARRAGDREASTEPLPGVAGTNQPESASKLSPKPALSKRFRPQPRTDQFTLAETPASEVMGLWTPRSRIRTERSRSKTSANAHQVRNPLVDNITVGIGDIPGYPYKYRPQLPLPKDAQDYLDALWAVLRILKGETVTPMFGGKKAGLIQGWTYVVDDEGYIHLKPWAGRMAPLPMPTDGQDRRSMECHIEQDRVAFEFPTNDGNLPAGEFALRMHEDAARRQRDLDFFEDGTPNVNNTKFVIVVECFDDLAVIATGYCAGPCDANKPLCKPHFVMSSWFEHLKPHLEDPTAPAPKSYDEHLASDAEFATAVLCSCS